MAKIWNQEYLHYVLELTNCGKLQARWKIQIFRFSQQALATWWFSFRFLNHAVAICLNVSEECTVSIFRVTELVWLDTKVAGEKKISVIYTRWLQAVRQITAAEWGKRGWDFAEPMRIKISRTVIFHASSMGDAKTCRWWLVFNICCYAILSPVLPIPDRWDKQHQRYIQLYHLSYDRGDIAFMC
jgi:hypothetical protein